MAKSVAFGFLVCLASVIVWIGEKELNNACNALIPTPNFALWLIVFGSVEIFATIWLSFLPLLDLIVINRITYVFVNMFLLVWLIINAYLLSQITACEGEKDQRLYNTMLAAVIIGFVGFFCRICQTKVSEVDTD